MVDVQLTDGEGLARAEKLLAGISGGFEKAVKSAMTRTVQNLRSSTGDAIRERYDISQTNLRTEQNVKIRYMTGNRVQAHIVFAGHKIPLYRFGGASPKEPTVDKSYMDNVYIHGFWKKAYPGIAASGHQLKESSPGKFDKAFVARMKSGHVGIFERTGDVTNSGSDAIQELMGTSIPQMLGSPKVEETLAKQASEKFNERLEVEINRMQLSARRTL